MAHKELLKHDWLVDDKIVLERLIEALEYRKFFIPKTIQDDITEAIKICGRLKTKICENCNNNVQTVPLTDNVETQTDTNTEVKTVSKEIETNTDVKTVSKEIEANIEVKTVSKEIETNTEVKTVSKEIESNMETHVKVKPRIPERYFKFFCM
jgi:hypothetical protein